MGARESLPFVLVIMPFGVLFGVVATEAGLPLLEVMSFTVLVIAGAAQFTAVQMLTDNAPVLIILAASLAVNLRMAMYSASLAPYFSDAPLWKKVLASYVLVDQTYALCHAKYEERTDWKLDQRMSYLLGVAFPICPLWYVATLIGALLGTAIPPEYALDFALPITFLALVVPALRTAAHVAAASVSVGAALALSSLPSNSGLLIAAGLAMVTGVQVELWMERRK